uniref:CRIB domain-containing protein n=1 Tax=Panagrolaimus sp. ES5 TaxID=591445 RepID=A0AC34F4N1_9BILA
MTSTPKEKSSKVPFRSFLGRIFNNSNNGNEPDSLKSSSSNPVIGHPYNTVHKLHVGFDGTAYSGLPQEWLELLHRDLT